MRPTPSTDASWGGAYFCAACRIAFENEAQAAGACERLRGAEARSFAQSVPVYGKSSTCPITSRFLSGRSLSAVNASTDVSKRRAMRVSVSPFCTTYAP